MKTAQVLGLGILLAGAGQACAGRPEPAAEGGPAAGSARTVTHPYAGVTRTERRDASPRPLSMHVIEVDLDAPGIRFKLTPRGGPLETIKQSTLDFMTNQHAQIAVNMHFFEPWPAPAPDPGSADLVGLAASEGDVYSAFEPAPAKPHAIRFNAQGLNIDPSNRAAIVSRNPADPSGLSVAEPVKLWNAFSGSERVLSNGVVTAACSGWNKALHPRTAVGLATNRRLVVLVVDGRQAGVSEGMTVEEVARLLKDDYGVTDALNMDGGGSSTLTMVLGGVPRVVNRPSDGAPRTVGSNLAIFAAPAGPAGPDSGAPSELP